MGDPEATDTRGKREKRAENLSKDGQWRSFPKVPNLLQYVNTGGYYARVKKKGKLIRRSLETDVWSTARLRLLDFLKEFQTATSVGASLTFSEAVTVYEATVRQNPAMKERSKGYRLLCIRKIKSSWPELWNLKLTEIEPSACRDWAARLRTEIASQYFNNTIATLRLILDAGIREHAALGGGSLPNPAGDLARARIQPKELVLPERDQFRALVDRIRQTTSWADRAADLIEFLAYGGMRLYTEANQVKWEDVDWQRKEIIVRGDQETGTKNWEIRRIPMLPDMENLLTRMLKQRGESARGKLLEISECPITLDRACKELGIARITHHDLRHLFATRCIESGVDIPTVSRWLGHKDGGALAMKTYGHLRNEHSRQMAEKVRF